MQFETELTFEKLQLEIESLKKDTSIPALPLCIAAHSLLSGTQCSSSTIKKLSQITYELVNRLKDFPEEKRVEELNHIFFEEYAFQIVLPEENEGHLKNYCLESIFIERKGSPLILSLLFQHFCFYLDIPLCHIQLSFPRIFKWTRSGKCCYLDFLSQNRSFDETILLGMLSKSTAGMGTFNSKNLFYEFLRETLAVCENNKHLKNQRSILSLLLLLEKTNIHFLSKRAKINRYLGHIDAALSDVKRFFSFTSKTQAPADLKMLYYELQALKQEPLKVDHNTEYLH